LGPQQLGTLADLSLPCHAAVELRLSLAISEFHARMPRTLDEFRRGAYVQLVNDFEVDNFGSKGDRLLLDHIGIFEGPPCFAARAARLAVKYQAERADSWWRAEGLLHQRVVAYAELDLEVPLRKQYVYGHRFQQNGYQGSRKGSVWIVPTSLPFNQNVDRSLCSENQLMSLVLEEVAGTGEAGTQRPLEGVRGWLQLFVTGAPCLSCVGAMVQFQLLLPAVAFAVCIGPELHPDGLCHW